MMKKLGASVLSTLLLSGCSAWELNKPSVLFNNNTITSFSIVSVENNVNQKRMEEVLAILTGYAVLPDGSKILERGSAEGKQKTIKYIISYLEAAGYKVEKQAYKTGENLVALLPADRQTPEYILIGAHFDSVRNAGADDNGTGTVAVMESAMALRELKEKKVNILFALFDEEERGLIGSSNMANKYKKEGKNIIGAHTLDMVGWDSDKDKAVEVERPDGNLWDYYVMANKTHDLKLPLQRTSTGSTDHVSFHEAGFNSVGLSEEWTYGDTTPYYHKKTDTYSTINTEYLASTTRLVVAVVSDMCHQVKYPATPVIPHNMFPGRERTFLKDY